MFKKIAYIDYNAYKVKKLELETTVGIAVSQIGMFHPAFSNGARDLLPTILNYAYDCTDEVREEKEIKRK